MNANELTLYIFDCSISILCTIQFIRRRPTLRRKESVRVCSMAPLSLHFTVPGHPRLRSPAVSQFKFKFKQSAHLTLFSAPNLPSAAAGVPPITETRHLQSCTVLRELSHNSSLVETRQWLIHPDFLQKPWGGSVEGSSNCTLLVPLELCIKCISNPHRECHPACPTPALPSPLS